jgi:hypothetical protein
MQCYGRLTRPMIEKQSVNVTTTAAACRTSMGDGNRFLAWKVAFAHRDTCLKNQDPRFWEITACGIHTVLSVQFDFW